MGFSGVDFVLFSCAGDCIKTIFHVHWYFRGKPKVALCSTYTQVSLAYYRVCLCVALLTAFRLIRRNINFRARAAENTLYTRLASFVVTFDQIGFQPRDKSCTHAILEIHEIANFADNNCNRLKCRDTQRMKRVPVLFLRKQKQP